MGEIYEYITNMEPAITQPIEIIKEIEHWKRKHPKQQPSILIDLEELCHMFVKDDAMGMVFGGRYTIYNDLFCRFRNELAATDAKLIFFDAGSSLNDELIYFIPSNEDEYIKYISLLDQLETTESSVDGILSKIIGDRLATMTIHFNFEKLCRKNGELRVNYFRHSQQIAQYAHQHADEVLAIISNNMDFLLFEGTYQFWSANDINLKDLTTNRFCPDVLKTTLVLSTKQLQMVSVLCGSMFLPREISDKFVKQIGGETKNKISTLANYVKGMPSSASHSSQKEANSFDFKQIASDVFGPNHTTEDVNTIEFGFNRYNLKFSIHSIDVPFMKFSKEHNSFIYKLITDDIFLIKDIAYIDYRHFKSKNYVELIVPLLQKLLGIFFKDNRLKPVNRKICMKFAHDEPYKTVKVPIIYPTIQTPPLFDLIYKNRESKFYAVRWSLLAWVFDIGMDVIVELKISSSNYTTVMLTLLYLLRQGNLTTVEADAILYTEFLVREAHNTKKNVPKNISNSSQINVHYVRIAHLYTKIYVMTSRCMEVCGLNRFTNCIKFDGLQFYNILSTFEAPLSSIDYDEALSKMQNIRIY